MREANGEELLYNWPNDGFTYREPAGLFQKPRVQTEEVHQSNLYIDLFIYQSIHLPT